MTYTIYHIKSITSIKGIPASNHLKKGDLGTIFNKKRDFKIPIFNENGEQFKK